MTGRDIIGDCDDLFENNIGENDYWINLLLTVISLPASAKRLNIIFKHIKSPLETKIQNGKIWICGVFANPDHSRLQHGRSQGGRGAMAPCQKNFFLIKKGQRRGLKKEKGINDTQKLIIQLY